MNTLRDYYTEMGVDIDTLLRLNRELSLPRNAPIEDLIKHSTVIKRHMMQEAQKSTTVHNYTKKQIVSDSRKDNPSDITLWPGEFIHYYSDSDLIVGAVKPGKEAGIDHKMSHYEKCKCSICKRTVVNARKEGKEMKSKGKSTNDHDMLPVIIDGSRNLAVKITYTKDRKKIRYYTPWTLDQIAKPLEYMLVQKLGRFGVELFGTILFRAAFNIDHSPIENKGGEKWRMVIPPESLEQIEDILPNHNLQFSEGHEHTEFSVPSLFYFFDILGVNEDIKVHAGGRVSDFMDQVTWRKYDRGLLPSKVAYNGRTNTLLTYCEMIAIMLNRSSVGDSMIGYHRGKGMYPFKVERLGLEHAFQLFPLLSSNLSEQLDLEVTNDLGWLHSARD